MPSGRPGPLVSGALVVALAAGCAPAEVASTGSATTLSIVDSPATTTTTTTTPTTTTTTTTPPPPVPMAAVVEAAEQTMPPSMTLGVAALNLRSGELVTGRDGQRQFYSASLAKLMVVVDMYDRRRLERRGIADRDLPLVARALSASDDGAMNALWGRYDGPGAIGRVAARLGLGATKAPGDVNQWGETLVTAGDLVKVYQHILTGMPPEDRAVIVDALAATAPTAADGFNQFFGLLGQGASDRVYAKQGWVSYQPARLYLHSAGVVHDVETGIDYAIALLSIQPSGDKRAAMDRLSTVAAAAMKTIGALP
jgi:hypothetical protein